MKNLRYQKNIFLETIKMLYKKKKKKKKVVSYKNFRKFYKRF